MFCIHPHVNRTQTAKLIDSWLCYVEEEKEEEEEEEEWKKERKKKEKGGRLKFHTRQ